MRRALVRKHVWKKIKDRLLRREWILRMESHATKSQEARLIAESVNRRIKQFLHLRQWR